MDTYSNVKRRQMVSEFTNRHNPFGKCFTRILPNAKTTSDFKDEKQHNCLQFTYTVGSL